MSSLDINRSAVTHSKGPLSGICRGGPKAGQIHATLNGRRTPMEGGDYFYRADPNGHHLGVWIWVPNQK